MTSLAHAARCLREQAAATRRPGLDAAMKGLLALQIVMPRSELPGALGISRAEANALLDGLMNDRVVEIIPSMGPQHRADPLIKLRG